ncbi:hypothetical protein U2A4042410009 [Corynebacterium striatum]|nr:hypothetical protein U2A4042410009 [Corynebacterium striatum]
MGRAAPDLIGCCSSLTAGSSLEKFWQGRQDSNLQPTVLETVALPVAPRPYAFVYQRQHAQPYQNGDLLKKPPALGPESVVKSTRAITGAFLSR